MWLILEASASHRGDVAGAGAGGFLVAEQERLFIAIYNDQGLGSRYWTAVKRFYNSGFVGKISMILLHLPYLFGARYLVRLLSGRLNVERGFSFCSTCWIGWVATSSKW